MVNILDDFERIVKGLNYATQVGPSGSCTKAMMLFENTPDKDQDRNITFISKYKTFNKDKYIKYDKFVTVDLFQGKCGQILRDKKNLIDMKPVIIDYNSKVGISKELTEQKQTWNTLQKN
uniref:Uncharacterized protein n=1 Tax=Megaselia scalaris TaxID=36166 RepID=T1GJQ0_MEGSC